MRPLILILVAMTVAGCGMLGPSTPQTGATGQYGGAIEGGQSGATMLSQGGNVTINITPNPGITLPPAVSQLIEKISEDKTIPIESKVSIIERLSAPFGGVSISISEGSGGGDSEVVGGAGSKGAGVAGPVSKPDAE